MRTRGGGGGGRGEEENNDDKEKEQEEKEEEEVVLVHFWARKILCLDKTTCSSVSSFVRQLVRLSNVDQAACSGIYPIPTHIPHTYTYNPYLKIYPMPTHIPHG